VTDVQKDFRILELLSNVGLITVKGVNPGGTGGTRPPKVCVGGDTSCIVPPKMSDDTGH